MPIFKHKESGKCLSFGEFAHSCNGDSIILEDCEDFNEQFQKYNGMLDQANGNLYQISQKNNNGKNSCIMSEDGNSLAYSTECASNSVFEMYADVNNTEETVTASTINIKVAIIFNDNSAKSNVKKEKCNYLHNTSHNIVDPNAKFYYVLYDFDENTDFNNLYNTNNGEVKCKVKYVINENINGKKKKTAYHLIPTSDKKYIIFSNTSSDDKLTIKTIEIKTNSKTGNTTNVKNYGVRLIGTGTGREFKAAQLNIKKQANGFTLVNQRQGTKFRFSFLDSPDRFIFSYHDMKDDEGNIKLKSYINPNISVYRKGGKMITGKISNKSTNHKDNFKVSRVNENGNIEGFSGLNQYFSLSNLTGVNSIYEELSTQTRTEIIENVKENVKTIIESFNGILSGSIPNVYNELSDISTIINDTRTALKSDQAIEHHSQMISDILDYSSDISSLIKNIYGSIKYEQDVINNFIKKYGMNTLTENESDFTPYARTKNSNDLDSVYKTMESLNGKINSLNDKLNQNLYISNNISVISFDNYNTINNTLVLIDKVSSLISNNHNTFQKAIYIHHNFAKTDYASYTGLFENNNGLTLNQNGNDLKTNIDNAITKITYILGEIDNLSSTNESSSSQFCNIDFSKTFNNCIDKVNKINELLESRSLQNSKSLILEEFYQKFNSISYNLPSTNVLTQIQYEVNYLKSSLLDNITNVLDNYNTSFEANITIQKDNDPDIFGLISELSTKITNAPNGSNSLIYDAYIVWYLKTKNISERPQDNTFEYVYQYYNPNKFLRYINKSISNMLVNRSVNLYNSASLAFANSSDFSIPSNSSLKDNVATTAATIEAFTNKPFIEGFTFSDKSISDPTGFNICRGDDTDHKNIKAALRYGLKYNIGTADTPNFVSLDNYIVDKKIDDPLVEDNSYCFSVSYERLDSGGIKNGLKVSDLKAEICSPSLIACANVTMTLGVQYGSDSGSEVDISLVLTNSTDSTSKEEYLLTNYGIEMPKGISGDFIEFVSKSDEYKTSFTTDSSKEQVELLTYSGNTSDMKLSGVNALYSDDYKFRLVIKEDGELNLQYVPRTVIDKSGKSPSHVPTNYGINGNIYIRNNNPKSDTTPPYNVGELLDTNLGYIGMDNKYTSVNNTSGNVSKESSTSTFTKVEGSYTLSSGANTYKGADANIENACKNDNGCIGYLTISEGNQYLINSENKSYLHRTSGDNGAKLYIKQYGLNVKDSSGNTYVIPGSKNFLTSDKMFNTYNSDGDHVTSSPTVPTLQNIMQRKYNKLKGTKEQIKSDFKDFVSTFNELSENEMKMLKNAGINAKEMNNLIGQFDELYSKQENILKYKDTVDVQIKESEQDLYLKSQYLMAATGLASIGACLFIFNTLKN